MTTLTARGAIWHKHTLDQTPFELNAIEGREHVVIRVPGPIEPRVTYRVPRERGFDLMKHVPGMTLMELRSVLRLVGDEMEVMTR